MASTKEASKSKKSLWKVSLSSKNSKKKSKKNETESENESEPEEKTKPTKDKKRRSVTVSDPLAIVNCTACARQINPARDSVLRKHPDLSVLICKKCWSFYHSGEVTRDEDGLDEQCRWCGEGGKLIGCDFCHNMFCKSCILRNFGRSELSSILDDDEDAKWKCYSCNKEKLLPLVEQCDILFQKVEDEKQKLKKALKDGKKSNGVEKKTTSQGNEFEFTIKVSNILETVNRLSVITNCFQHVIDAVKSELQPDDDDESDSVSSSPDGEIKTRNTNTLQKGINAYLKSLKEIVETDVKVKDIKITKIKKEKAKLSELSDISDVETEIIKNKTSKSKKSENSKPVTKKYSNKKKDISDSGTDGEKKHKKKKDKSRRDSSADAMSCNESKSKTKKSKDKSRNREKANCTDEESDSDFKTTKKDNFKVSNKRDNSRKADVKINKDKSDSETPKDNNKGDNSDAETQKEAKCKGDNIADDKPKKSTENGKKRKKEDLSDLSDSVDVITKKSKNVSSDISEVSDIDNGDIDTGTDACDTVDNIVTASDSSPLESKKITDDLKHFESADETKDEHSENKKTKKSVVDSNNTDGREIKGSNKLQKSIKSIENTEFSSEDDALENNLVISFENVIESSDRFIDIDESDDEIHDKTIAKDGESSGISSEEETKLNETVIMEKTKISKQKSDDGSQDEEKNKEEKSSKAKTKKREHSGSSSNEKVQDENLEKTTPQTTQYSSSSSDDEVEVKTSNKSKDSKPKDKIVTIDAAGDKIDDEHENQAAQMQLLQELAEELCKDSSKDESSDTKETMFTDADKASEEVDNTIEDTPENSSSDENTEKKKKSKLEDAKKDKTRKRDSSNECDTQKDGSNPDSTPEKSQKSKENRKEKSTEEKTEKSKGKKHNTEKKKSTKPQKYNGYYNDDDVSSSDLIMSNASSDDFLPASSTKRRVRKTKTVTKKKEDENSGESDSDFDYKKSKKDMKKALQKEKDLKLKAKERRIAKEENNDSDGDDSENDQTAKKTSKNKKSGSDNSDDSDDSQNDSQSKKKSKQKDKKSKNKKSGSEDSDDSQNDSQSKKKSKQKDKKSKNKKSGSDDSDDSDDSQNDSKSKKKSKQKDKKSKKKESKSGDSDDGEEGNDSQKKSKKKSKQNSKDKKNKLSGSEDSNDSQNDSQSKKKSKQNGIDKKSKPKSSGSDDSDESQNDSKSKKKSKNEKDKKSKNKSEDSDDDSEDSLEKEINKLEKDTERKMKTSKKSNADDEDDTSNEDDGSDKETEETKKHNAERSSKNKKKKSNDGGDSDDSSSSDDGKANKDESDEDSDTADLTLPMPKIETLGQDENEAAKTALLNDLDEEEDDKDDVEDDSSSVDDSDEDLPKKKSSKDKPSKVKDEEDCSDSDFEPVKKKRFRSNLLDEKISDSDSDKPKKKKNKKKSESDDNYDEAEENDSDESDIGRKKKKKNQKSTSNSESDSDSDEKKKKRKRIKRPKNSSDEGGEDDDEKESPTKGGRKKIRKLISDKKVTDETKAAAKAEEDRRKRVTELQKKFNIVTVEDENSPTKCPMTTKLVLESNKEGESLVAVNKHLIKKLKPHQVEAVQFMWSCCIESLKRLKKEEGSGCILAHCMGLGKTLSVVSFVHTVLSAYEYTNMETCLIVSPLNTVLNWRNECSMWLKSKDQLTVYELSSVKDNHSRSRYLREWTKEGGIMIIGYEMYRNLTNTGRIRNKKLKKTFEETLVDPGPDLCVCDEGHILKNEQSAISQSMNRIKTKRRIILTGTPLQNNLNEYHCMISFVKPKLLGTRKEFLNRFVNPITNGQCSDSTGQDVKVMKRRAHVLHEMLAGCVQRKDYSALTKYLPPKLEYVISVRLAPVQMTLYEKYLENSGQLGGNITARGGRLFQDYQALSKIWTHPYVLKLAEIRQESKMKYDDEDDEDDDDELSNDSFIDDSTSASSSSTDNNSDDDIEMKGDSDSENGKGRKIRKTRARAKKDSKSKKSKDDTKPSTSTGKPEDVCETARTWKTRSRGGITAEDELLPGLSENGEPGPISSEWWAEYIKEADRHKLELSGKLSLLFQTLQMCEEIGDKVLVFSQSLLSLDIIEDFLDQVDKKWQEEAESKSEEEKMNTFGKSWTKGADYFRMDGTTTVALRQSWAEHFNNPENYRARLFIISTKAGGLGINLVGANRAIIFDASWNPSHDVQSIFRVYRFGQIKPVYIYRYLAQGTMEEKIYERQVTKQSLSQRVVDEHQIERHFTANDLQELYAFRPDRLDDPNHVEKTPILPKDTLLAELLKSKKEWIVTYHEHDSLLENKIDEGLSEDERKSAWEEYETDKNKQPVVNRAPMGSAYGNGTLGQMGAGYNPQMNSIQQRAFSAENVAQVVQLVRSKFPQLTGDMFQAQVQNIIMQQIMQYQQQQEQELAIRQRQEMEKLRQFQSQVATHQRQLNQVGSPLPQDVWARPKTSTFGNNYLQNQLLQSRSNNMTNLIRGQLNKPDQSKSKVPEEKTPTKNPPLSVDLTNS